MKKVFLLFFSLVFLCSGSVYGALYKKMYKNYKEVFLPVVTGALFKVCFEGVNYRGSTEGKVSKEILSQNKYRVLISGSIGGVACLSVNKKDDESWSRFLYLTARRVGFSLGAFMFFNAILPGYKAAG